LEKFSTGLNLSFIMAFVMDEFAERSYSGWRCRLFDSPSFLTHIDWTGREKQSPDKLE